jgi:elongation factor Ts
MAEITAAAVKSLRDRTGLPMMKCKQALEAAQGDEDKAIEEIRKASTVKLTERQDRETAFGRFGLFTGLKEKTGAMVEVKCESAPVAGHAEFVQFAGDLAKQLATGPGAKTADELLAQPSPSKPGQTLQQQKEDLFSRMGEVFNVGRIVRFDGPCGGYAHFSSTVSGVLIQVEGGNDAAAKDVAMHVAAMKPSVLAKEEMDPVVVAKEKEILMAQARGEGKPENIIEKMVEGRMRNFYAQHVLLEQPYIKDDKQSVEKYAKSHGMKVVKYVHWILGVE